jgi:hypothetical protein
VERFDQLGPNGVVTAAVFFGFAREQFHAEGDGFEGLRHGSWIVRRRDGVRKGEGTWL